MPAATRTLAERKAHSERYGGHHRRVRSEWARKVERGVVQCSHCGELILPGQRWDLDHADDGDPRSYLGPAHARCNRAVAGPPRTSPRPNSSKRGYGKRHKRLRAAWAPQVAAGSGRCVRCGVPIAPGERGTSATTTATAPGTAALSIVPATVRRGQARQGQFETVVSLAEL